MTNSLFHGIKKDFISITITITNLIEIINHHKSRTFSQSNAKLNFIYVLILLK